MKNAALVALAAALGTALFFQVPAIGATKEHILYSFCNQQSCADGEAPDADLISEGHILYGTTTSGGASGEGAVFSVSRTTGREKVLYSFMGGADGSSPLGAVVDVKDWLYGTTFGNAAYGTVFAVDPATGTEKTVYSFCSQEFCRDGEHPGAGLINVKGTLYGTTEDGGAYGGGTVFSVDLATGTEAVIHSFGGGNDGEYPRANLIYMKGALYGTTSQGGNQGTVYSVDLASGTETVLHFFGGGTDGVNPLAGVVNIKGILYGTTNLGGAYNSGTVFSIDPTTDAETVVYSFCSVKQCEDGAKPQTSLIGVRGRLYGTTFWGGSYNYGTVFSVDPATGNEVAIYSFKGSPDGVYPAAGLINMKGTLYGTTQAGGAASGGGTVFALRP